MEIYWCNVQPYSSYYGIVFLLFLCLIIKKLRLTGIDIWNCALKIFNAENCGSTLLIGDENNLSELADISVNILKLPTENPTNPENMGMLVMLNGFGDCIFQPTRFRKFFNIKKTEKNIIVNLTGITINPVSNQNDFNFSMANEIFNYNDGHQVYIFNSIENPSSQMIIKFDQSRNIETAFHIIQEQCNMKYYNFRYTITDLIDETSVTYQIRKNDISYTTYSRLPGESFNDCFVRTWTEFAQDTLGIITSILAPREIAIAVALSCAIPNNPPVENPSQKPVTFTLSK